MFGAKLLLVETRTYPSVSSTSYIGPQQCLAKNTKSRLLQLTSCPSGHQGESLRFIGAHPWHAKGLAGKVVWIGRLRRRAHIHVVDF